MKNVVVVAPHADDESLGAGGTLLRHKAEGHKIHWVIVTSPTTKDYSDDFIKKRKEQISKIKKIYNFDSLTELGFEPTSLNTNNFGDLLGKVKSLFNSISPNVLYTCYPYDAHSDHLFSYKASIAATKKFRTDSIERVLMYETLSETNFSYSLTDKFNPNYYINVTDYFDQKMKILSLYDSEIKKHPFPRSKNSIKALAELRGSESNTHYAEAFQLLKFYEK